MEGKILACRYARENQVPFLGICLGLQMAVVEFGRNILGLNAYSREMLEDSNFVPKDDKIEIMIDYMEGQAEVDKGGSMRLGNYDCQLKEGSLIHSLFGQSSVVERHRHRLEVQNQYVTDLESKGLIVSGKHYVKKIENLNGQDLFQDLDSRFLVEMIELDSKLHPSFVATQSHPEFLSRPGKPHPLFLGLVKSVLNC
jgi:CTP synthase